MIWRVLLVVLGLALGAGRAVAQGLPGEPPPVPHNRVGFGLGIGSAVGLIGLTYQYASDSWWRIEGGLGWGLSGVQLSAMPKVALGGRTCVFLAGLGPALGVGGPYAQSGPEHQPQPGVVGWLNLDAVGFECRSDAGFAFEMALGLTLALTTFHYDITDVGGTIHAGDVLPQARLGLGWWF